MQRPSIPPPIKPRCNLNIIKTRAHIRDYPENQEQPHPRHAHNHRHILTRQPQRNHAAEIQHPVHNKRTSAIRHGIPFHHIGNLGFAGDGVRVREVDLESHADKGVGEREEEVGGDSSTPAPEDELGEF